ncbi:MAG: 2OG-Fe(II) oxygenase [Flavobacteriales bacterium]|nr:2OG-Fe(II) oxygenase [Flavobacteriales bacterium]
MLEFKIVSPSEIPDGDLVSAMRHLDFTGLIVKNFLSDGELKEVKQNLNQLVQIEHVQEHLTFPNSFSRDVKLDDYLGSSAAHGSSVEKLFESGLLKKIEEVLQKISGGKKVQVPDSGKGKYLRGTFRIIHPLKCHIDIHCGNQFFSQFPDVYQNLTASVDVKNQLSFFILLQKPDDGGELVVYDALWEDFEQGFVDRQTLLSRKGFEVGVNDPSLLREQLKMSEGDLLVFQGGQFWHKVTEVYGSKHRITFGGFIGFSKTDESIYYWS